MDSSQKLAPKRRSGIPADIVRDLVKSAREFMKTQTRVTPITADSPGVRLARARADAARIREVIRRSR